MVASRIGVSERTFENRLTSTAITIPPYEDAASDDLKLIHLARRSFVG